MIDDTKLMTYKVASEMFKKHLELRYPKAIQLINEEISEGIKISNNTINITLLLKNENYQDLEEKIIKELKQAGYKIKELKNNNKVLIIYDDSIKKQE